MGVMGGLAGGALAVSQYADDKLGQIREDELLQMKKQIEIEKEKRIQEAVKQNSDYNRQAEFDFNTNPGNISRTIAAQRMAKEAEDKYNDSRFPEKIKQKRMEAEATRFKEVDPLQPFKEKELEAKTAEHLSKAEKAKEETKNIGKEKQGLTPELEKMYGRKEDRRAYLIEELNSPENKGNELLLKDIKREITDIDIWKSRIDKMSIGEGEQTKQPPWTFDSGMPTEADDQALSQTLEARRAKQSANDKENTQEKSSFVDSAMSTAKDALTALDVPPEQKSQQDKARRSAVNNKVKGLITSVITALDTPEKKKWFSGLTEDQQKAFDDLPRREQEATLRKAGL
jgi:hypothetical protein